MYHKWLQCVEVKAMIHFKFRLLEKKISCRGPKITLWKFSLNFHLNKKMQGWQSNHAKPHIQTSLKVTILKQRNLLSGLPLLNLKLSSREINEHSYLIISGFWMRCLTNWLPQLTCSQLPPTGCSSYSNAVKTIEKNIKLLLRRKCLVGCNIMKGIKLN
jgi:hypothetical protein